MLENMSAETEHKDDVDLSIGGVLVGKYMKSSSRWALIAGTAAIISAIAAITSVVLIVVTSN